MMSNSDTPILSQIESSDPLAANPVLPLVNNELNALFGVTSLPSTSVALRDYGLVRELGRGGMAIVYEAVEIPISRRVAIKILPSAAAMDERQLTRFRTEALATARLDHPHIIPVYGIGCESGIPFYTMKYVDGHSLAKLIEEHRQAATVPSSREFFCCAARWGIQAAEALHYAHSNDVLHGDVKPANILVDKAGHLWLIDFGATRTISSAINGDMSVSPGTLRYLSPERIHEDATSIDRRSDVYALGATLFEVITLRPAVIGDNSTSVLSQITQGTPPLPRACNEAIPPELEAIICRAMATNPHERYATAAELADDLRRFLGGQPVAAKIAPDRFRLGRALQRRSTLLTAAATAIVLSIASQGYLNRSTTRTNLTHRPTVTEEDLTARRLAAAFAILGTAEVYAQTGRIQEAKQQAEQVIDQINTLYETDPENSETIVGLAYAHTRVGAMLAHVLPPNEAEQHHRTAIGLIEPLTTDSIPWHANASFPFRNYQDALAECRVNLASIQEPSAEPEAILNSAIASLSDLPAASETDAWRTDLLARVHKELGSVLSSRGRHAEAEHQLLLSIGLFQQLSADFPAMVRYQFGLANAESEFGGALASAGKKSEANDWAQRAIDRLEQLVTNYPDFADGHHRLAGSLNNIINLTNSISSTDAILTMERALHHELIAIRVNPEHRQYQRFASIQYGNLTGHWEKQNEYTQAAEALAKAIKHRQFVIQHGGSPYRDRHDLGHDWLGLGSNLAHANRDDEAEEAYRSSTEQFRELVEQFGRKPHDLCMLAEAFNKLSGVMEKRDDIDRARQYLEQAIASEEEAMRSEPSNADHRKTLAEYQARFELLNQSLNAP